MIFDDQDKNDDFVNKMLNKERHANNRNSITSHKSNKIVVQKRKGYTENFSNQKIQTSLIKAGTPKDIAEDISKSILSEIIKSIGEAKDVLIYMPSSELRQKVVIKLEDKDMKDVAKAYSEYRKK